jgi:GABA(A) receptor-associated protein
MLFTDLIPSSIIPQPSFTFKDKYDFKSRVAEARRVIEKYPDRIPVICEKNYYRSGINVPQIDKNKYLVPEDLTIGQFIYVIRKRLKLPPETAIFIFISGGIAPAGNSLVKQIYNKYKDCDGFLYISYSAENTFGNDDERIIIEI